MPRIISVRRKYEDALSNAEVGLFDHRVGAAGRKFDGGGPLGRARR